MDGKTVETVWDLHPRASVVTRDPNLLVGGVREISARNPHHSRNGLLCRVYRGHYGAAGRKFDAMWFSRFPGVGAEGLWGAGTRNPLSRRIYQCIG